MNQRRDVEWISEGGGGLLELDEIHIHLLRTGDRFFQIPTKNLLGFLSSEDRGQYQRLELESGRLEFLWSRLLVGQLMSRYLKREMGSLKFNYQEGGKPFLENSGLQFNLSHTLGLIVCSLGRHAVGVDIEKVDVSTRRHWPLIAKRHFSPLENEYLWAQPPQTQLLTFFRIFTMKEARVKALGTGLRYSLSGFTVPLPLADRSRSGRWEYFAQDLGPEAYCLAHAVENPNGPLHRYQIVEWDEKSLVDALKKHHSNKESPIFVSP